MGTLAQESGPGPVVPTAAEVEAAVTDAYLAHREQLVRSVTRSTRDADAAEDVVQDAYLRLLVAVRAGNSPDNVPAWLHRVTTNLVIDRARRNRAVPGVDGDPVDPDDPETLAIRREEAEGLRSAIAWLPPQTRRALVLNGAGYGPIEIAGIIGRTDLATRTLLCRARRRTRELLEPTG